MKNSAGILHAGLRGWPMGLYSDSCASPSGVSLAVKPDSCLFFRPGALPRVVT